MQLYGIRRRSWWKTPEELEAAAGVSKEVGDEEGSGVRWIRSYVLVEDDGTLGTYCIYEAESPEAIRAHGRAADLPVDEIVRVADTVLVRPDPTPAVA
jgi:sporulation protein YlmC with PRC-barrel domain